MNLTEIQQKVFRVFCQHGVSIMQSWYPYPCTNVQKRLPEYSLYKVRKTTKELVQMGLIEKAFLCEYEYEDSEYPCLINGWNITEKAKETDICKECAEEEKRIVKECFDIDI